MLKQIPPALLITFLFFCFTKPASVYAQKLTLDSSYSIKSFNHLSEVYHSSSSRYLPYNGTEHRGYFNTIRGFAYFNKNEMVESNFRYNNTWYTFPLLYDLVADELVIDHFIGGYRISLVSEKIDRFNIEGHRFIYFRSSDLKYRMKAGFYEILYQGSKVSLYSKHIKSIRETTSLQGLERVFESKIFYYLFLNRVFYPVKSEKDMLSLLEGKKKEIKSYFRNNRIKYKKSKEASLILAVKLYDESI